MSDVIDRFMADLIKGAEQTEGFVRGSRIGIEISRNDYGHEEKLAGYAPTLMDHLKGAGLGGAVGGLAGPLGAAALGGLQDQSGGSAFGAGAGSLIGAPSGAIAGGLGGASIGALIARIADKDPETGALLGAALGIPIGVFGGSMLGAHLGQNRMRDGKQASLSVLEKSYTNGACAASNRFQVKQAFLGMLGSFMGGTGLRSVAGSLAKRGESSVLGRMGQGIVNTAAKGGLGSHAIEMGGNLAGGAIGNRLQGPPPQQM